MSVHPTAVVAADAGLAGVEVGPFAVIGAGVELAPGVVVGAHAVLTGPLVVGAGTRIGAHAVIGTDPQDRAHDGSPTQLVIGADNVLREHVTVHRGSSAGRGATRIGDGNLLMVGAHVAHDCQVGDRCTFANGVMLGGHVEVGDDVVFGGLVAVHQGVRIGRLAMLAGGAMVAQDVPPFCLVHGDRARLVGVNTVGLRRAGLPASTRTAIRRAVKAASGLGAGSPPDDLPEVQELRAFYAASERGVCGARALREARERR